MLDSSNGPFDLIFGLPLHVFVNHAVVVLVPLGALALVLTVVIPALRKHYLLPSIGVVAIAAVAAIVATQSGEALEIRVGSAGQHGRWGELVVPVTVALVAVSILWALIYRSRNAVMRVLSVLGAIAIVGLSAASVTLVAFAGHSGAELTWGGRVAADSEADTQAPIAQESDDQSSSSPEQPATDQATLSVELVSTYSSADACWSIVNGQVYDLTPWINEHPGGSSRILGMCGRDASADFSGQHGGEQRPEEILQGYLLGALGDPVP